MGTEIIKVDGEMELEEADEEYWKIRRQHLQILAKAFEDRKRKKAIVPYQAPEKYSIPLGDEANAQRLIHWHGKDLLYCPPLKTWFIWNGKIWRRDDSQEIIRRAKDVARRIAIEVVYCRDEELRRHLMKWAIHSMNRGPLKAMIQLAESELPVQPKELDADPWLFNCWNGTVNLRTGERYDHEKKDKITKIAPVNYEPKGRCPRWLSFIYRIMDGNGNLVKYLRRIIGYSLTGSTKEQCLFLLYGLGANGKSTFLEVIRTILGDYAYDTPFSTFLKTGTGAIRNDLARLPGARFVTAVEPERGKRIAENVIKQLTGGDKVTARYLYKEFFEHKPNYKIFLAANHMPEIRGTDAAIWRRIRLISFKVQIPKNEQDKGLADKLLAERDGILAWAVRGCLDWQREGLSEPHEILEATEEYQEEMDVLKPFIDECFAQWPKGTKLTATPSKKIREVYLYWCQESHTTPLSEKMFGAILREKGFEKRKGNPKAWYLGISPKYQGRYNFVKQNIYFEPEADEERMRRSFSEQLKRKR